jgi:hypothetical protein
MLFSKNGVPVEIDILGDDSIHEVALKLTMGQGGVYLYGKQKKQVDCVSIWQKYKRPLHVWELTAELRNLGIRTKVPNTTFEYEDLMDYIPKCDWHYVALGQYLPQGVRVRPPGKKYSLAEFNNIESVYEPGKRLLDYDNLVEIHAVQVHQLQQVYIPQPAGILHSDTLLKSAVSNWVWTIVREIILHPKASFQIDLESLFAKVHPTRDVPHVVFKNMARTLYKTCLPKTKCEGITFYFLTEGSHISFRSDGSVKAVKLDSNSANPIIHYVNRVLQWGTALECDSKLMGKSVPHSPLFSEAYYSLWTATSNERVTIATETSIKAPSSTAWNRTFTPSMEYTRCSPFAVVEFLEGELRISNLPADHIPYVSRYAEAWLCGDSDGHYTLTEDEVPAVTGTVDVYEAFLSTFVKAGYTMGLRFKNGVLAMDDKNRHGYLPCPAQKNRGIRESLLKPWTPTLAYAASKEFLEYASKVEPGLSPKETVYNHKGDVVALCTQNGGIVPCKAQKIREDELRKTTEYELLFPKTGMVYGTYCAILRNEGLSVNVQKHVVVTESRPPDFPQWCEDKLLLTADDLNNFQKKLKNDMTRSHRFRCYMLCKEVEVEGRTLNILDEEIVVI